MPNELLLANSSTTSPNMLVYVVCYIKMLSENILRCCMQRMYRSSNRLTRTKSANRNANNAACRTRIKCQREILDSECGHISH